MCFYCILSASSVYKFSQFCRYVGRYISDNYTEDNYFDPSPNHDGTWKSRVLKATLTSFQLENPLSMNSLSRFELFNFPSL